ncbi:GNAT family N-acetyltransferase [Halocalculus aciditolerans]|uniref:N-acetyltransferase n=1 Tax=Halocalculus aciditolerans TaxID=1383812 RepID=A0A830FHG3_9EURY|nr:GNAT family N-acetyltransferase [Halocalculus aciditolerans]GGL56497.1 N-acetyltransferase [Halocalculus aciditolerans]
MEYEVVGDPDEGPTLELDWREFAYAGKFVMSNTGKAVAREDGEVVAAVAFNADRTDGDVWWLRYVTVREGRKGEGVGPRLCAFTAAALLDGRAERVRIAVNNPFAYHALHKAGFGWTGRETGIAELVLERPAPADAAASYGEGLVRYLDRDLSDAEEAFVEERRDRGPPARVDVDEAA